uniref:Uncharacterized protein n=1 Tax=Parascaris univalens TaxID=6257 RepID=A0A915BGH3_PARUN
MIFTFYIIYNLGANFAKIAHSYVSRVGFLKFERDIVDCGVGWAAAMQVFDRSQSTFEEATLCESERRTANSFTNLLQHIEGITLESQRNLHNNCDDGIEASQRGNPLRYELVPPQYLSKRRGYAVCRRCAVNAHHTDERKFVNLFEHHNEESTKAIHARQLTIENKQVKRITDMGEKKFVKTKANGVDQRQIYLTIELSGCLINAIHAITEAIKATKALQFVSGDLYPSLMRDLKLLHEFYERLRNYNTEIRRMSNSRKHHHANNQEILPVDESKLTNPLTANKADTNETNVTISDHANVPLRTTGDDLKGSSQEIENLSVERSQPMEYSVIRPTEQNNVAVEVKRTLSALCFCEIERKNNTKHLSRSRLGPLWTRQDYLDYLET